MATQEQKDQLLEVLKFTPRTYKISLWGYGGETVMGTVDRKVYDYFKKRRIDLSDYAWSGGEETDVPEDLQPFYPGSWYDCDNMGHASGVARNAGTIQIEDENGETVYQKSLEDLCGMDSEPEWCCNDEVWVDSQPAGTVVFVGRSNEKGTFFEADLPLTAPFDIEKLQLQYDEIDGEEIVNRVFYDGEEIDNWGGSTDGKSSDFGFYIAGSQQPGKGYEKYRNMDDIEYEMTPWFPKKINPVREGVYMVKTAGKNSYTYQCKWTGSKWVSSYIEPEDFDTSDEIKIKEWQGLASDPDADVEWDPVAELDKIVAQLGAKINGEEPKAVWPFAAGQVPAEVLEDNEMTEQTESTSKWWTVRTHYKKSCEQHEYYVQRDGEGRIKVVDGFRFVTYNVETNDGEFPKFEFTTVPGGDGKRDSLDLNSLYGDNIESAELVEMFDGGCWGDTEITGIDDEEEVERLEEFLSEEGAYALEDEGEWYLDETEVWVWGPIEVEDEDGNIRIIIADEDGNMIDFVKE